ncbi:MAG TPA: nucleotide-binding domain containing protein, partial [Rubellimicrobium sp.]|nr:nucleotide-binding domain containing protein [Rubellimicrobium sp.]
IAEACKDMVLLTGGSAVAMPLPEIWVREGRLSRSNAPAEARHAGGPAIVLSGSCSAMTNRQVAAYVSGGSPAFRLDPLALAEEGPAPALQWLAGQDLGATPIVYATAEPTSVRAAQDKLGAERAGLLVEDALAACAVAARDAGVRRLVVAGGETSGAVAKALGIERLNIGAEIAPGVPWCFAISNGHDVAITLKSGNFGQETFFADALKKLTE